MIMWIEDGKSSLASQLALSDIQKRYVLVLHNECIFYANDSLKTIWTTEDRMPLFNKKEGKLVIMSNYTCDNREQL